jgi:hypothetical protein
MQAKRVAREYLALLEVADRRDVQGLWIFLRNTVDPQARLDGGAAGDWKAQHAARLLIELGEPTAEFAAARLRAGETSWPSVFLARIRGDNALPDIVNAIAHTENVHQLETLYYALTVVGTPRAWEVIRSAAATSKGNRLYAARTVLEKYSPPAG